MHNKLIVRPLPPLEELLRDAAAADTQLSAKFAASRRREFLAWRAIVRSQLGEDAAIGYNVAGAPVTGCDVHIGVSHSRLLAAVVMSDAPCAVDTEPIERNFERVAPRFMRPEERALSDDRRLTAAVWCAKEVLHKLSGRCSSDMLRDLHVVSVDFQSGRICGIIRHTAGSDAFSAAESAGTAAATECESAAGSAERHIKMRIDMAGDNIIVSAFMNEQ